MNTQIFVNTFPSILPVQICYFPPKLHIVKEPYYESLNALNATLPCCLSLNNVFVSNAQIPRYLASLSSWTNHSSLSSSFVPVSTITLYDYVVHNVQIMYIV